MSALPSSNGQGALFELVARGIKDKYFVDDNKDSKFTYDARYSSSAPHLGERRTFIPVNGTTFGGTFDVEIDAYGDILTECSLDIQLPSWFPPLPLTPQGVPVSPSLVNSTYSIRSVGSELSYGYVNYVGYFLFEKIQFYQDQFLLQEWSGDGLLAKQWTEGSSSARDLSLLRGGQLDITERNTTRNLELRATPPPLSIRLPLPGLQSVTDVGLPLLAMPWQTLRLRITLRKLEDLVVCSDTNLFSPSPWTVPLFHYTFADGISDHSFAPLSLSKIGHPTVTLSTFQRYVTPETQQELRDQTIQIPFRRMFENRFTFGELDFISLDKGGVSAVTRRLEGRHPTERVFWWFRLQQSLDRNRLDEVENPYFLDHLPTDTQPYTQPYGQFYYRIKLLIAGRDRERLETGEVWNGITPWAKQESVSSSTNHGIGTMSWGRGDIFGSPPSLERVPEGTVNFTTADRPTLYLELANVPSHPLMAQRLVEMRVWSEGWNIYEIKEGRGRLLFSS